MQGSLYKWMIIQSSLKARLSLVVEVKVLGN